MGTRRKPKAKSHVWHVTVQRRGVQQTLTHSVLIEALQDAVRYLIEKERGEAMTLRLAISASLLALLFFGAGPAAAYTCSAAGCTWETDYPEPSTLTNGQPLTDLTGCTATVTASVDGGPPGVPKTFAIPASKATGGGVIAQSHSDATLVPPHVYILSETVACTSAAFGTGPAGPAAMLQMNNGVGVPAVGPTLK